MIGRVLEGRELALLRLQVADAFPAEPDRPVELVGTALATDLAFMNPGGIRDDLRVGTVTWGELFSIQPFANDLVSLQLTGDQVRRLLELQWAGQTSPKILKCSGLEYTGTRRAPPAAGSSSSGAAASSSTRRRPTPSP